MQKLVIFGAGQNAELALHEFSRDPQIEVVAFTVDRNHLSGNEFRGRPLVAFEEVESCYELSEHAMYVAISFRGVNRLRAEKYAQAKAKGQAER